MQIKISLPSMRKLSAALFSLLLFGCAYPVRNQPATQIGASGYRWNNLKDGRLQDTLIIVTASGGGTRAAALELSVLEGLDAIELKGGGTMAEEIDIISSVSGGSVTSAYFALHGTQGLAALKDQFIKQNNMRSILLSGLNPVGLARISTPKVERIDLLIEHFNKTLFPRNETYATLLEESRKLTVGRRPYLILNAADMVEGTPFALTQENFDLLCSDMTSLPLSTAVAASAAFPVFLSPVTLKNYSPCSARSSDPPRWVTDNAQTPWYDNPERAMRGRAQMSYFLGRSVPLAKKYVHLLDGGIADNLGLAEPRRIITTNSPSPGFANDFAQGAFKKIVVVMINARSFLTSDLDQSPATPDIGSMLSATISSGIDQTAAGSAARFRDVLTSDLTAIAASLRPKFPEMADNLQKLQSNISLVAVDFDAIQDETCRTNFHNIGTSWTNSEREVEALLLVGKGLVRRSPGFGAMLEAVKGEDKNQTTLEAACARIAEPERANRKRRSN